MRGREVKLHTAYLKLGQFVCSLTSTPQLELNDELIEYLYFKMKLKLWTGSQVEYGILELWSVHMHRDFSFTTSTSW